MGKKGTVSLQIEDSGVYAYLVFSSDDSGDECTREAIAELIKKSEIKEKPDEGKIGEFLKQVEQSEEKVSYLIAEGKPPVPPSTGVYRWKELPVPEELVPDSERIFKTALDPEITKEKVEKVKVRKKVKQKSKFPFNKEKEKLVTVIEKRVKKEPVEIDPEVVSTGWVDKGMVLAEKEPPSEGEEGLSVTGEPIAPGEPVSETYYCGNGVREVNNKLVAETSGFVRRGKNWVEIIPFENHFWEVVLSKDKSTPLLNLKTGNEIASPPFAKSIIQKAVELGFSEDDIISSERIFKIIAETINSNSYLENYPLTGDKDASFSISVSDDLLKGYLNIEKGSGNGKPLKLSEVGEAIKKSGFVGLNYKKIKEDLVSFYHSGEKVLKDYLLAEGKPAGKGEPRKLKFECTFLEEKEGKSLIEELKKERESADTESEDQISFSKIQKCAFVGKDSIVASIPATKMGASGKDVYGKVIPGMEGDLPEMNLLEHLRFGNGMIVSEIEGVLLYSEDEEGSVSLAVVYNKQTSLKIEISEDAMKAFVTVHGGLEAGISGESVRKALKDKGIVKGVDEAALETLIDDVTAGKDVDRVLVAAGKKPVHEGTSRFKLLIDLKDDKNVSIQDDGHADYKNQDRITIVTKGTRLGIILSPDFTAEDGWDITGKVIKAEKAPPLELEIGENIIEEKDEKGHSVLVAENGGELFFDTKKISVKNVHVVKGDIGLNEGNIKFPGSVKVGGNVSPGFFVIAEGEVQIAGSVNAALISSGESIIIGQGVIGGGKAVLRSKMDIDMAFAEQATILAVGNIRIKNSCLRCRVKCNGKLSLVSDKGDLVGGQILATGGVDAHNIGNKIGVKTVVFFGQNYLIQDQIEKEEKELEKLKEQITKLDMMMKRFEKEGRSAHLMKARKQKFILMKSMEKKGVRLFTLREKFEEHFPSEISVRGTLYPGVIFESHGRYYDVKQEKKSLRIYFNQEKGRIEDVPLKKEDK